MKKIALITIIILHTFSTFSQEHSNNYLETLNINGNVKSINEISYKAIYDFDKIKKGKKQREAVYMFDYKSYFDRNKNIIKKVGYNSDGSKRYKTTFKYNKKGYLINKTTNFLSGDYFIETYFYNKKGYKIKIKKESNNGYGAKSSNTNYKYNNNGNLVEREMGKYITLYEYDMNNNLIKENSLKLKTLITYKYDNENRLIQSFKYISNKPHLKKTYEYDTNNNITLNTEIRYYEKNSNKTIEIKTGKISRNVAKNGTDIKYSYKYLLDDKGNWVKKIKFINSEPKFIIERNIEYY